jgi:hypothetical protein
LTPPNQREEIAVTRLLAVTIGATALLFAATALAPTAFHPQTLPAPDRASAQVSKSRGASGGSGSADAAKLGDRAAQLGSGWAIPLTIFIAGLLLTAALVTRNIGAAIGVILVAVLALIFFASPDSIRQFAEGVGRAIF